MKEKERVPAMIIVTACNTITSIESRLSVLLWTDEKSVL